MDVMRTVLIVVVMLSAGAGVNPSHAQVNTPVRSHKDVLASGRGKAKEGQGGDRAIEARVGGYEPGGGGDASTSYYDLGAKYALAGRHSEAIGAFKKALLLDPSDANAHFSLGNIYTELGRWDDAVEAYQQAVALNPKDSQAFNNLGVAYLKINSHERAVEAFEQAVRIYPKWAAPHCNLSGVYYQLGRLDAAAASFKRAVREDSGGGGCTPVTGGQVLAGVVGTSGRPVNSNSIALGSDTPTPTSKPFGRPARTNAKEARALYDVGFKHGRSGKYADAAEAFKKAISLNPGYGDAYFGLGQAYIYLGRWSEAVEAFEKVCLIDPKDDEAYEMLGKAYASLRARAKTGDESAVGVPVALRARGGAAAVAAQSTPVTPPEAPLRPAGQPPASGGAPTRPTKAAPAPASLATVSPRPRSEAVKEALAPPAATAEPPAPVDPTNIYRVGVGDVLDVRLVDDRSGNSTLYTVTSGGLLEYPLATKPIRVSGLTADEIAARLVSELKSRAIRENPEAVVGVREYSSHNIIISGLVAEPGTKVIRREAVPLYVIVADARPGPEAGQVVIVSHTSGNKTVVDIGDQAAMSTLVYPGDVLLVEKRPPQFFYIGGQVSVPGEKSFHPGITLTQAILKSGGTLSGGGTVKILRQNSEGRLLTSSYSLREIVSGKTSDPPLQPNDRVTITR